MKKFISLIILCMMIVSCHRYSKDLRYALESSGDNRGELEKVLNYYSKDSADSLKLKAAEFLITYMPGHVSYGGEEIGEYYDRVDSVLNLPVDATQKRELVERIAIGYPHLRNDITEDIKIITAEYLIYNIERAFDNWQNKQWNKHLTFDQFCEFLLPYKVTELQQLDYWQDTLLTAFGYALKNNPDMEGHEWKFSNYAAKKTNEELCYKVAHSYMESYDYGFMSAKTLYKIPYGLCDEYAILTVSVLRSRGIPAVVDFLPIWINRDVGHSWYATVNTNGKSYVSPFGYFSEPGESFPPMSLFPKVYRMSYTGDMRRREYLNKAEFIHPMFAYLDKDVTPEYARTFDLSMPVNVRGLKDKYVYIAVFDNKEWRMVDFGIVKNQSAHFVNMAGGIMYMIFGYNGSGLVPISTPFTVDFGGQIKHYASDKNNLTDVRLTRKFPKADNTRRVEEKIVGGMIEASNNKDFSSFEAFYRIDSVSFPDIVQLDNQDKYRYWRYVSPPHGWCNIAELYFFEEGHDVDIPVTGEIIGMEHFGYGWDKEHAFDGDWLTCYSAKEISGGWIGLDLGEPKCIDRFRCVPRSDDNGIHYDDRYELFYWEDNRWVSLGEQTAKDKFLDYENVPEDAVLLLSNHTRGKEERIFTLDRGRQVWW